MSYICREALLTYRLPIPVSAPCSRSPLSISIYICIYINIYIYIYICIYIYMYIYVYVLLRDNHILDLITCKLPIPASAPCSQSPRRGCRRACTWRRASRSDRLSEQKRVNIYIYIYIYIYIHEYIYIYMYIYIYIYIYIYTPRRGCRRACTWRRASRSDRLLEKRE